MRIIIALAFILTAVGCSPATKIDFLPREVTVTNGAVQVLPSKYFLVRHGDKHAAIMLTDTIAKGDGGFKYIWYYQSDGSGSFANRTAKRGTGEVFEKYIRIKNKDDNGNTVTDDGGIYHIQSGELKVTWSLSTWIYFDSPGGKLEIANTSSDSIKDINYLDKTIVWHKKTDSQHAPPAGRGEAPRP